MTLRRRVDGDRAVKPTDRDLADRIEARDLDAWAELWTRHWPAAYQTADAILRHPERAKDVVSTVFARIEKAILSGGLVLEGPLRPYLSRAIRNAALDETKRAAKERGFEDTEMLELPFANDEIESDHRQEDWVTFFRAFLSLSEDKQRLLELSFVRHVPPRNMGLHESSLRGVEVNTISQRISRAERELARRWCQERSAAESAAARCPWSGRNVAALLGDLPEDQGILVAKHIEGCADCAGLRTDLAEIPARFRLVGLPLLVALRESRFRLRLATTTNPLSGPAEEQHAAGSPRGAGSASTSLPIRPYRPSPSARRVTVATKALGLSALLILLLAVGAAVHVIPRQDQTPVPTGSASQPIEDSPQRQRRHHKLDPPDERPSSGYPQHPCRSAAISGGRVPELLGLAALCDAAQSHPVWLTPDISRQNIFLDEQLGRGLPSELAERKHRLGTGV